MILKPTLPIRVKTTKGLKRIRADKQYLNAQPLPRRLVGALRSCERVYVSGKPHGVKAVGISEDGQIIGKLEPLEPSRAN